MKFNKNIFIFSIAFGFFETAFCQNDCSLLKQLHISDSLKIDSLIKEINYLKSLIQIDTIEQTVIPERVYNEVHLITDTKAKFPGGRDSMILFITNELRYPTQAIKNKAEAKVVLNFIVDSLGRICCIKNNGKKDIYGFEEEAIRIISRMPIWIPATKDNKPVNSYYQLPITFRYYEE
ncbi:MAG: energy transducer TonB [Bacteroidia bacterium]|nr:energy transducer TonB [Bacteroidia bacterium]